MAKLNGWQRIWVVICTVALVCALTIIATDWISRHNSWPTEDERYTRFVESSLRDFEENASKSGKPKDDIDHQRQQLVDNLASGYGERRSRYWSVIQRTAVFLIMMWVGGSIALYAIGWGVAWAIRGFRRE